MEAIRIYGDTPEQRERVRGYLARALPEMDTHEVVAKGKGADNHAPTSLGRVVLDPGGLARFLRFLLRVGR